MGRLEKLRYEKIFNSKLLCRKRGIDFPKKEDEKQDAMLY